jgi:photosystem II stability/assembly factor-like uncharacterized protein
MKKRNFILVFFLLFLFTPEIFPQSGWILQSPMPTFGIIYSVKFINNSTGLFIGYPGIIIKTTDGGESWRNINSYTNKYFKYLNFINQNTGFITGSYSIILKTTNTGDNWSIIYSSSNDYFLSNTYFINQNTGYVYRGADSVLLKTTNCGDNWMTLKTNIPNHNILSSKLYFINENTGFYSNMGFSINKTTNGGILWNSTLFFPDQFNCFYFFDINTGFAFGNNGKIIKTTNTGENWTYQTSVNPNLNLTDVKFIDSLNGYLFANYSGITYKTTDKGNNWNALLGSGYKEMLGFDYPDLFTGYTVGANGKIIKTTNSGENWCFISSGTTYNLNSIRLINDSIGFAVGTDEILKTTNKGKMWLSLEGRYNSDEFVFVHCFDVNKIIVASWSTIQKTTNGGLSWYQKMIISSGNFSSACFINNTGYYNAGSILGKSTDAGETWQESNPGIDMEKIFFINENTGFASSARPDVYKTTNGGMNWNLIYTYNLFDGVVTIQFTDSINGFITTYTNLLKTTNGGYNWVRYPSPNFNVFSSSYMLNENTGFVTCNGGYIIKTTNSGQNWIYQNSGTTYNLNYIYFLDSNVGYTVGQYGIILKTTNGGSVWVNNQTGKIPDEYFLYQNYPNPFNPNTNIKYQITNNKLVVLRVYDILGKEVSTLVNEKQSPGMYEVTFDGSNFASGIYFYRIQAGDFVQVKKMVMIK